MKRIKEEAFIRGLHHCAGRWFIIPWSMPWWDPSSPCCLTTAGITSGAGEFTCTILHQHNTNCVWLGWFFMMFLMFYDVSWFWCCLTVWLDGCSFKGRRNARHAEERMRKRVLSWCLKPASAWWNVSADFVARNLERLCQESGRDVHHLCGDA